MAKRNALQEGLMGAVLGGLNFQLSEQTRRRAEEAELLKEQRLEAIRAASQERQNQFQIAREDLAATRADERLTRQQEQQLEVLDRQQEQQLKLEGVRAGNQRALQAQSDAAANERSRIAASAGDSAKGVWGDDGNWYPAGSNIPVGVTQVSGMGVSYAPPASRTGATQNPGLMGAGVGGANGAPSGAKSPPAASLVWDPQRGRLVPAQ